jgi:hypothetical protein
MKFPTKEDGAYEAYRWVFSDTHRVWLPWDLTEDMFGDRGVKMWRTKSMCHAGPTPHVEAEIHEFKKGYRWRVRFDGGKWTSAWAPAAHLAALDAEAHMKSRGFFDYREIWRRMKANPWWRGFTVAQGVKL